MQMPLVRVGSFDLKLLVVASSCEQQNLMDVPLEPLFEAHNFPNMGTSFSDDLRMITMLP